MTFIWTDEIGLLVDSVGVIVCPVCPCETSGSVEESDIGSEVLVETPCCDEPLPESLSANLSGPEGDFNCDGTYTLVYIGGGLWAQEPFEEPGIVFFCAGGGVWCVGFMGIGGSEICVVDVGCPPEFPLIIGPDPTNVICPNVTITIG